MYTSLFRAAHANFARDGMHVHAAATTAHVGPKRMLALFFNDDRNIGANLAGDRFRREMEIRRGRYAQLNCTGYCPKFPVVVRAWISLHENASRGCMCLHVFCCPMNLDFATGGIRFDSPPGFDTLMMAEIAFTRTSPRAFDTVTLPEADDTRTSSPMSVADTVPLEVGSWGAGSI